MDDVYIFIVILLELGGSKMRMQKIREYERKERSANGFKMMTDDRLTERENDGRE